jgi:hypothetical protein
MKGLILASGFALLLATGSPLATAQSTAPATQEEGTVITAEELENDALPDIETVRVVDVELLLAGAHASGTRDALEESDPAAIRDYLQQGSELAERIRDALREAEASEDEVVALILHEENQLIVLYWRGS